VSTDTTPGESTPAPSADSLAREARIAGLRGFSTPSLEAVEHRRIRLWVVTTVLMVSVSIGVAVLSILPVSPDSPFASHGLRWGIVALSIGFCVYAIDRERRLQRLAKMLTDERVLTAALSNRLRELSLLLQAGTAMNAVLELEAVLEVILGSAIELLNGRSGSVMLVEGDDLVVTCVKSNPDAMGRRMKIGEGLAGRVGDSREPLLVNGRASAKEFPGLPHRVQPVDSAMCVPLVNRNELVGVLNVNAETPRTFTEYDLRALSLFAEQAAVAIANARLFDAERAHVVELVELDRLKSEFLGLVTHELRTPLTIVLAAAQTGLQPDPPMEVAEILEIIDRNGKHLASMVEELLVAARLEESGASSSEPVEVNLGDLIRDVARDFEITDRPVEVEIRDELTAVGDPDAFRRILANLLDNAHKYGATPVRVVLERRDGDAVLSVSDSGPGLPVHQRERLFERFYRADETGKPGLGLGLPIVRGLATEHGGDVWAGEAPGGGAEFHVRLPLTPARAEAV
jgi:signal transduction histidine kinase